MGKVRVPVLGTIGKSVVFDDSVPDRVTALEVAVAALQNSGVTSHHALTGLQEGDDHPQYTMWAAAETIAAPWNFSVEPFIFSVTLTEFIEDVVGGSGGLIADSPSIVWAYDDTAGSLTANLVTEYAQDLVGAMLVTTPSVTLTYNDPGGTFSAAVNDEYIESLVAGLFCDSLTIAFDHYNTADCITGHALLGFGLEVTTEGIAVDESESFTWTGKHIFAQPPRLPGYTVATLPAGVQGDEAYVTDALLPSFLTAVAGGGSVVTPVFFDGTNWVAM